MPHGFFFPYTVFQFQNVLGEIDHSSLMTTVKYLYAAYTPAPRSFVSLGFYPFSFLTEHNQICITSYK